MEVVARRTAQSYPEFLLPASRGIWFRINYHLFGFNPTGWHVAMVALHLLAVWLAFKIVRV